MGLKERLAEQLCSEIEGAGPEEIIKRALEELRPSKIFVGFSGGFDSLVATHWSMNNVPGCEVFHANTDIGIEATRRFVRETCTKNAWPYTEISAKNDCGQDYDELVERFGFPGPGGHSLMFRRLKERSVRLLLKRNKQHRNDRVMLITGIRQDESARRSGYQSSVLSFDGSLLWCSAFYYRPKSWFSNYIREHGLQQNPVSQVLGMSGECLCGAFAHPGEKQLIKIVCPETFERIEQLEAKARAAGHSWGWEDRPPKKGKLAKPHRFCVGCSK